MANSYKSTTKLWVVDSVGALETAGITVTRVIYIPAAAGNDLQFTDSSDNLAIPLKAGASDASPIHLDLTKEYNGGRMLTGIKCSVIDGGTAYVFLKKTDY